MNRIGALLLTLCTAAALFVGVMAVRETRGPPATRPDCIRAA